MKIIGDENDSLRAECSVLTDYFGIEAIDEVLKARLGSIYSSKMGTLNQKKKKKLHQLPDFMENDDNDKLDTGNSGNNSQKH